MSAAERQRRLRGRRADAIEEIRAKILKIEDELRALRGQIPKAAQKPRPQFAVPDIPPSPDISRQRLQQKLIRFVQARYPASRAQEMVDGLMGLDPVHHSGWWLDTLAARMKSSGWDDKANGHDTFSTSGRLLMRGS